MEDLLIYTTVGNNPQYIPFLDLFCESLCSSNINARKNVLVISDINFHTQVHRILSKYAALNFYIMDVPNSYTPQEASMNKTKLFEFDHIYKFKLCMFVDIDCLFMNNLEQCILKSEIKDNSLYVYSEYKSVDANKLIWYCLSDVDKKICHYSDSDLQFLKKYNKFPFNAGLFLFKVSETMQTHFENVRRLVLTYDGFSFYEQGFLNTYFHLTNVSNNSIFTDSSVLMLHNRPISEYSSHTIVHFNHGEAGDAAHKQALMTEFWNLHKSKSTDVTVFPTRNIMIQNLVPPFADIIEIGVFKGDFAEQLMQRNPKQLYLVDIWEAAPMQSGNQDGNNVEVIPNAAVLHTLVNHRFRFNSNVKTHRMPSGEFLKRMKPDSVDAIYIDGDHSYEGVKLDLENALPIVRKYGWIMGHDYEMNMEKAQHMYEFGVKRAVDEFCLKYGLRLHAKGNDGCVSYAILVDKK
jgi:hypothetical protein